MTYQHSDEDRGGQSLSVGGGEVGQRRKDVGHADQLHGVGGIAQGQHLEEEVGVEGVLAAVEGLDLFHRCLGALQQLKPAAARHPTKDQSNQRESMLRGKGEPTRQSATVNARMLVAGLGVAWSSGLLETVRAYFTASPV